ALEALIMAGGCDAWGKDRRQLLWRLGRALDGANLTPQPPSLGRKGGTESPSPLPRVGEGLGVRASPSGPLLDDLPEVALPAMTANESLVAEYAFTGVSSGRSPASLYREALTRAGAITSAELQDAPNGVWVRVGGQVIVRQRPP